MDKCQFCGHDIKRKNIFGCRKNEGDQCSNCGKENFFDVTEKNVTKQERDHAKAQTKA